MLKFITIAALLAAAPAVAHSADAQTRNIATADLDLSSANGIARLDQRVEAAAKSMCVAGSHGVVARNAERVCRAEVLAASRQVVALAIADTQRAVRVAANAGSQPGA